MVDTLKKVAIKITNTLFKLWDKAQIIVALTQNKVGKIYFSVQDKEETINEIISMVKQ